MHILARCAILIVANHPHAFTQIVQIDDTVFKGAQFEAVAGWHAAACKIISDATLLIMICVQGVGLQAQQIVNV